MTAIEITSSVYTKLCNTVGTHPPEAGAAIGTSVSRPDLINICWFDEPAGIGSEYYRPSQTQMTNTVNQWSVSEHRFAGIIHSHHAGFPELSPMDLRSGILIMEANHMPYILLGLFHQSKLSIFHVSILCPNERPVIRRLEVVIV